MLGDKAWSQKYSQRLLNSKWTLVRAVWDHYAIKMYLAFSTAGLIAFIATNGNLLALPVALFLTVLFYPLVEYALHRFVLHSNLLYRSPITAPVWRRLHYDHHMKPDNLTVLFAAPMTSVPLLLVLAAMPGTIIDLRGMFPAMITTVFLMFTYYEFMHASAHLKLGFHSNWIVRHKQSHMSHHFVCETQNYGIGTQVMDKLAGTDDQSPHRTPTVRNLGYDNEIAAAYPWVRDGFERDYGSS
jgi:hypothetical protein